MAKVYMYSLNTQVLAPSLFLTLFYAQLSFKGYL